MAGQPGNGRENGPGASSPLERFYDPRAVRSPGEFVDDGGSGLGHAGNSVRDAKGAVKVARNCEAREAGEVLQARMDRPTTADIRKLLKIMVGTIGFEPTTSSVSTRFIVVNN